MHCRVFLIDYGRFLDGVVARLNVRALPKLMRVLPPQAFQIVLAGKIQIFRFLFPFLYLCQLARRPPPVFGPGRQHEEPDAGHSARLEPPRLRSCQGGNNSNSNFISVVFLNKLFAKKQEAVSLSKDKLVSVTNFAKDARGRVHGTVRMLGVDKEARISKISYVVNDVMFLFFLFFC